MLRTRKSASSAEVAANGGTPPPSNSDGLPLKLREKFLKGKMGESPAPPKKKKGTAPSTPTSKVQIITNNKKYRKMNEIK